MPAKPKTFDECLATISEDKRAALEALRRTIRAAVPRAVEGVNYGLAAFLLDGTPIAGLGAGANHCAFYPMSGSTVATLKDDLKDYETSKGAIRFHPDKPLPAALVRKVIKARIAEIEVNDATKKEPSTPKKRASRPESGASQTDAAVVAFLSELDHPLKKEILSVRQLILGVSPEIREGIKWKAPSFRTTEYFATVSLRSKDKLQLVFHLGAKVREVPGGGIKIDDPANLMNWLAKDRCLVTLGTTKEIKANREAFQGIVREWIKYV
jgi:uncharacterized protein YdhG (YjbR/CyaY superfamily)